MIDRIEAISRISYLLNLAQEVGGYSRDMEELTAQDILNPLVEADVVTFNPEIIKKQKVKDLYMLKLKILQTTLT